MNKLTDEAYAQALQALQPPYVSIIVPVYNVEDTVYECLLSAVFQTLEQTEVVVVNDASTDGSQQVVDEFVRRFPDRVRCICHEQNQGLAGARRTGVLNARAPYVAFLDSDDFINGRLCEDALRQAVEEDSDILFYSMDWCDMRSHTRQTKWVPQDMDRSEAVRNHLASFCGALFRRGFLLAHQDIAFARMLYEDAATMPALVSRADRIGTLRTSMYFYNTGNESGISFSGMTERKMRDLLGADDVCWERIGDEFRPQAAERVLRRALGTMNKTPEIYDYCVFHIQDLLRRIGAYADTLPERLLPTLESVRDLPQQICIPKIVYINAFDAAHTVRDMALYRTEAERAYLFGPEVVALDEHSCPMGALPAWLAARPPQEQGLYFALRAIYERGGVYIGPMVRIVHAFNRMAFAEVFFVAGPGARVLPVAFGAAPGSRLIGCILHALEEDGADAPGPCVAEVLSRVLVGECGVHLSGLREEGLYGLQMLSFEKVCRAVDPQASYSWLDYSNVLCPDQDLICLPPDLEGFAWNVAARASSQLQKKNADLQKRLQEKTAAMRSMQERLSQTKNDLVQARRAVRDTGREMRQVKSDLQEAKNTIKARNEELKKVRAALKNIQSSRAWQMIVKARRLRNGVKRELDNLLPPSR